MQPDVLCFAEDLPFADGSFDVAVNRLAAHHYADVGAAVKELARVSRGLVVVEDLIYQDDASEQAELLRDPTHVRNYTEAEWRDLFAAAGLKVEAVAILDKEHPLEEWIARTGCTGDDARRVRELLAPRVVDGVWTNEVIVLKGRK
jgi:SAM-dependent methyltransferase